MAAGASPAPPSKPCATCRAATKTWSSSEGTPPMNTRTAVDVTAGYYQGSVGLRLFRLALGTAQKLWPALAVRAAGRLFCTPLPPKWLQRRSAWDAAWRREHWSFEEKNLTVYSQPAAPHGPIALLVHGWGGHGRQLLALADTLADQGF